MTLKDSDEEQAEPAGTVLPKAKAQQATQDSGENKQNYSKWYVIVATTASLAPKVCHALVAIADMLDHFVKMFTI